jgi:hypothetical protein
MERIAIDSTTLTWVGYSANQRLLRVGFHSGKTYDYFDVPFRIYHGLLHADSKGRYFNLNIRNHFRTQLVDVLIAG